MSFFDDKWFDLKGELLDVQNLFSKVKNVFLILVCVFLSISYLVPYLKSRAFPLPISNSMDVVKWLVVIGVVGTFVLAFGLMFVWLKSTEKFLKSIKLFFIMLWNFWDIFLSTLLILLISLLLMLFIKLNILLIAIMIFINLIFSFLIHYIAFFIIYLKYEDQKIINMDVLKSKDNIRMRLMALSLISPDYVMANLFKKALNNKGFDIECSQAGCRLDMEGICEYTWEQRKVRRKYFIIFSNWTNLVFALIFSLALMYSYSYIELEITKIIFLVLVLRIISRSFEISYAFYKDVVEVKSRAFWGNHWGSSHRKFINYWRSSSIRRPERISLAVHSYIEVILLFTLFYLFMVNIHYGQNPCDFKNFLQIDGTCPGPISLEKVQIIKDYKDYFLYSSSVTFFNFSFDVTNGNSLWNSFHVLQVFLSIILVVLSLAAYIGMNDDMDKKEEIDFLLTTYIKERKKIGVTLDKRRLGKRKKDELNSKNRLYDKYINQLKEEMREYM